MVAPASLLSTSLAFFSLRPPAQPVLRSRTRPAVAGISDLTKRLYEQFGPPEGPLPQYRPPEGAAVPQYGPPEGVGPPPWEGAAPWSPPTPLVAMPACIARGVPLTGDTLQAALKMRCDTTKASYAIYWANQNGKLRAVAQYVSADYQQELKSRGVQQSFADASKATVLDAATSQGPISTVLQTGVPLLVANVAESNLQRRELALKYGVNTVAFAPCPTCSPHPQPPP